MKTVVVIVNLFMGVYRYSGNCYIPNTSVSNQSPPGVLPVYPARPAPRGRPAAGRLGPCQGHALGPGTAALAAARPLAAHQLPQRQQRHTHCGAGDPV